jgi:purine-binding chemotaxis protein CheW
MQAITALPKSPSFLEGIINLRGKVLPVMDLYKRFNIEVPAQAQVKSGSKKEDDRRIVVVSMNDKEVGMIVDSVSEVLTLPEGSIEPTPPMITSVDSNFIVGIAKVNESLVILVDLGSVLTPSEKGVIQKALPVAG